MPQTQSVPPPARSEWAYFLDVDGTLLDLAATPAGIVVDEDLPALLTSLHRASGGAVALISGRALTDLDERLGVPALPKAGQHGLERRDAVGRLWLHATSPRAKQALRAGLVTLLERHPGLLLEDKGLTLAVHYRQAPELSAFVHEHVQRLVTELGQGLMVQEGKCLVEVKPAGVDKGTAVTEYLAEPPFSGRRPVFIGDDRTDEHGFRVVNERSGISIGVGDGDSCARFRLRDVAAVRTWLSGALELQP